jgi:hypothetical protein
MRSVRLAVALIALMGLFVAPAQAATGPSVLGGGSASDMTRFALAITDGVGHFECLMPAAMTVEAQVTGVDTATAAAASFHGVAQVTLGGKNPFGLPSGPMARDVPFTATVLAGGPGSGFVDLEIMQMSFKGTVLHGQVSISP